MDGWLADQPLPPSMHHRTYLDSIYLSTYLHSDRATTLEKPRLTITTGMMPKEGEGVEEQKEEGGGAAAMRRRRRVGFVASVPWIRDRWPGASNRREGEVEMGGLGMEGNVP